MTLFPCSVVHSEIINYPPPQLGKGVMQVKINHCSSEKWSTLRRWAKTSPNHASSLRCSLAARTWSGFFFFEQSHSGREKNNFVCSWPLKEMLGKWSHRALWIEWSRTKFKWGVTGRCRRLTTAFCFGVIWTKRYRNARLIGEWCENVCPFDHEPSENHAIGSGVRCQPKHQTNTDNLRWMFSCISTNVRNYWNKGTLHKSIEPEFVKKVKLGPFKLVGRRRKV